MIIKIMSCFGWFSIGKDAQNSDDDYMDGGTRILTRMRVQTCPPMLDAQVQIQRLVTKSFATFDGLTHVCDNEFALEDPPSENEIKYWDTSKSEAIMDALFTKATTLFYEECCSRMLLVMLLLLNLNTMHGVSKQFMDELLSLL
jgi:hypothetical protein